MNAKIVETLLILLTNFRICQSKTYEKFSFYSVVPIEMDHLKFLQNLEQQKYIDVKFIKKPTKLFHDVHFLVSPTDRNLLIERANHFKLDLNLLMPDVQKAFDDQLIRRYLRLRVDTYSWDYYHTLEDIYQWLTDLSLKYTDFVDLIQIGHSSEGREIFALKIKHGDNKKQVLVEGGIHGNEWISVEFVNYLAYQLISDRNNYITKKYTWYLIPILNPDGYEYNQRTDRLFNKNTKKYPNGTGVDLNRNFDYSFRKFATSTKPSDDNYGGPYPFSEPETEALRRFIQNRLPNLYAYVSVHSYGQKIIIPYADRVNHLGDFSEMANCAKQAIVKMYKLYGIKYGVGTFYDTMGLRISGNSASWVKKHYKHSRVFTFLLRDNGTYGYALPAKQIVPACEEAMTGLLEAISTRPRYMRADPFSSAPLAGPTAFFMFLDIVILTLK